MATTTPMQGFPIPEEADTPDPPRDFTNLADAVEKRVMGVYSTAADRDAKITSPGDGQFAYCQDTNIVWVHQDGAWVQFPPAQPAITSGTTAPNNANGNNGDIYFQV